MTKNLKDRRLFAAVAVVFAATTWFNWTVESEGEGPQPAAIAETHILNAR